MRNCTRRQAVSLVALLTLSPWVMARDMQAASTAPTAQLSAEAIDQQWIEANRAFDGKRNAILDTMRAGEHTGPFRADWQSLVTYRQPDWYRDAKFGIFVHWGVYSVPASGSEWYSRNMYQRSEADFAHHIATHGPQSTFGYKDFIPLFRAEHFDPDAWAALFAQAGARYVVPVAEHHDGFAMYDSQLSDWTSVKMGPHRDVIGELSKAIRAHGMHFGLSSHRAEHDWFFDGGRTFSSDVNDPRYAAFYGPAHPHLATKTDADVDVDWTYVSQAYLDDWLARTGELIDTYHPDLIYFDWWVAQPRFRDAMAQLASYYYNEGAARGTGAVINYKFNAMQEGSGALDIERGQLPDIRADHWQTDTSVSNTSWGYIEHDTFKSPDFIVSMLVDVVSKNGNLLLNIGPRADGTIPEQVRDVLLAIGGWLKVNGEAIYGSSPWKRFGEGPTKVVAGTFQDTKTKPYTAADYRFTTRAGLLYAIELAWPVDRKAWIHAIGSDVPVHRVTLLATGAVIPFTQNTDGLHLQLPARPAGLHAYVYRIELK